MDNSLEKTIIDYMGPQGVNLIKKALKDKNLDSANVEQYLIDLQILPRAVLSWAHNAIEKAISTQKSFSLPSTEYIVNISKNGQKLSYSLVKKTETIITKSEVEVPEFVLDLFKLTKSFEQISDFDADHTIQKAIDFFVKKFHFSNILSATIKKSETETACPDCGQQIKIDENHQKLCLCFKIFKKHLHIKKNTDGNYQLKFDGNWDKTSAYLLIKALKLKNK